MKKFLAIALTAVMLFSLAACGGKSIVGKWAFGANSFEFRDDNTVSISVNGALNYDGTYTVEEDKILVTTTDLLGQEKVTEFTYSLDGKTLTLTGDITLMGAPAVTLDFAKQ